MAALFATVLIAPPFDWGFDALGYVFVGQIATAVAVPIFCGFLSDVTVKFMSKKNNGISEVWSDILGCKTSVLTIRSPNIASSH